MLSVIIWQPNVREKKLTGEEGKVFRKVFKENLFSESELFAKRVTRAM